MDDRAILVSAENGEEKPEFLPLDHKVEVQTNLGDMSKPSNSGNTHLDEYLKNVILVDQESSSCSSLPLLLGNINFTGSLMSTKNKTIDEVWKEISQHDHHSFNLHSSAAHESLHHQKISTIGEPTPLPEHLLVRAGILNAHPMMPIGTEALVSQQADWFRFEVAAAHQQMSMLDSNFIVFESVFENAAMNLDNFSENHQAGLSIPLTAISATSTSESHQATYAERRRSYSDEMKEKSIERKQKRMIKNRESAARSRARKQAYTNQLESKVSHLEKRNILLKKQKEVEILLTSNPTYSMQTYQLRRTSSASF